MPLRGDFETEYDNDAEQLIAGAVWSRSICNLTLRALQTWSSRMKTRNGREVCTLRSRARDSLALIGCILLADLKLKVLEIYNSKVFARFCSLLTTPV